MRQRGRKIALLSVALGLEVLVAAAFLVKDKLLERWYLYRLEHGAEE